MWTIAFVGSWLASRLNETSIHGFMVCLCNFSSCKTDQTRKIRHLCGELHSLPILIFFASSNSLWWTTSFFFLTFSLKICTNLVLSECFFPQRSLFPPWQSWLIIFNSQLHWERFPVLWVPRSALIIYVDFFGRRGEEDEKNSSILCVFHYMEFWFLLA